MMSPQMQVVERGLAAYTNVKYSQNFCHQDTSQRKSTGRRCLQSSMLSFYGMSYGVGGQSVLPAITLLSLMGSTNIPSKVLRLCPSSGYSSSRLCSTFKSLHSGSPPKRILWRMQPLVMTTRNLLTLVSRYLRTFLGRVTCARSYSPSSQLPRAKHSAELQQHSPNLRILLSTSPL